MVLELVDMSTTEIQSRMKECQKKQAAHRATLLGSIGDAGRVEDLNPEK